MRAAVLIFCMLSCNMPLPAWDGSRTDSHSVSDAETLCSKLIANAKEIEDLLHSVKDAESANAVALKLEKKLREMRNLLAELETLPFDAETTQIITTQMMELTHIYQSYMPLIQELLQNNAYGSAPLMEQLRRHVADNEYCEEEATDITLPYADIYARMESALSTAVYSLRKTTDIYTAKEAANVIAEAYSIHQSLLNELTTLQNLEPHPAENLVIPDSLIQLKTEMQREYERLKELQFYGEPDLPSIIPAYLNIIP